MNDALAICRKLLDRRRVVKLMGASLMGHCGFRTARGQDGGTMAPPPCIVARNWYGDWLRDRSQNVAALQTMSLTRSASIVAQVNPQLARSLREASDQVAAAPQAPRSRVASAARVFAAPAAPPANAPPEESHPGARRGLMDLVMLWPEGSRVTFAFLDSPQHRYADEVRSAAAAWSNASCLRIEEVRTNLNGADIRIRFDPGAGHYSLVGSDSRHQAGVRNGESMNIDPGGLGQFARGIIRHEFGHAIGMLHEHQVPTVTIDWVVEALRNRLPEWSQGQIESDILNQYNDERRYVHSKAFDPDSVMVYWFNRNEVRNYDQIGLKPQPNNDISQEDDRFCHERYHCAGGPTTGDGQKPVQTDRQKLDATKALPLKWGTVASGDFSSGLPMHVYKFTPGVDKGSSDDPGEFRYIIETLDVSQRDKTASGSPVVLELFSGTDFSADKAIQTSRFGSSGSGTEPGTVGVLDAYLDCKLTKGQTYYLVVRPLNRMAKGVGEAVYHLLWRNPGKRPEDVKLRGTWWHNYAATQAKQKKIEEILKRLAK